MSQRDRVKSKSFPVYLGETKMNLVDLVHERSDAINHPGMTPWSLGTISHAKGLFFEYCNYNR